MQLEIGQIVTKPSKPDWGLGEVVGSSETVVEVRFAHVGYKKLSLERAGLEPVEKDEVSEGDLPDSSLPLNPSKARELCNSFILSMADNRKGFDDAGVAKDILRDLDRYGKLTPSTRRRLSRWCTTDGSVFQRGVEIAREISLALYGRVLTRE